MSDKRVLTDEQLNVDKYLKACANLYGYVTVRQFLKLYNRYNDNKINKEKYLLWFDKLQRYSGEYYTLYTNAVICSRLDEKKIDEIIYFQNGKKYYDPPKEELLKYADPNYYERNIYTTAMIKLLTDHAGINRLVAEGFLAKLVWYIRVEETQQSENELLEKCGIEFKNPNQANDYFFRLQNLNNNTRKWANCGYTPKELFGVMQP